MSVEDFDTIVNAYNSGQISKSDIMNQWSSGGMGNILDFNVGDFKGDSEFSFLVQGMFGTSSQKVLLHMIKHNNQVFTVIELPDNNASAQMYSSLIFK